MRSITTGLVRLPALFALASIVACGAAPAAAPSAASQPEGPSVSASAEAGAGAPEPTHKVLAVAAGHAHTCAVLQDHTLKCWGYNAEGNLGLGDRRTHGEQPDEMGAKLPAVDLGPGRTVLAVVAGNAYTSAILDDHSVKAWGDNYNLVSPPNVVRSNRGDGPGQMGAALPIFDLGPGRTAIAVAGNDMSQCALLDDHALKCWGNNISGQLGLGDKRSRGGDPRELGAALAAIDLGANARALAPSIGGSHACAILEDHTVKCWGSNSNGELGLGDKDNRGDAPNEMGARLPAVDLGPGRTALALALGNEHSCALLDDHTVKCWGVNYSGQLGLGVGEEDRRGDAPNEMGARLPAVNLGPGKRVLALAAGQSHTCAILDDHTVKCWGDNGLGQLGLGDKAPRGSAPDQMGANLPVVDLGPGRTARALAAGSNHTCAILDDFTLKCWGMNGNGQLGLGDTKSRGGAPNQMGNALPRVELW